jgi:hypothetical protein
MRRVTTALALACSLAGCGSAAPSGEPVQLLTGVSNQACYAGGEQGHDGQLLPDPEYGTSFDGQPLMWPEGFTAVRLAGGEVAVLDTTGKHIATTGRKYFIANGPVFGANIAVMERIGAYPAAAHCGSRDFRELLF